MKIMLALVLQFSRMRREVPGKIRRTDKEGVGISLMKRAVQLFIGLDVSNLTTVCTFALRSCALRVDGSGG